MRPCRHAPGLAAAGLMLLAAGSGGAAPEATPSARQVVAQIKANIGVPWADETVDTFKAGNADVPLKGIAVTMMATLDVLQRAAAAGLTMVITHEPTFYDHYDPVEPLEREGDAVLRQKLAFIEEHGLVVWRFHDHWHRRDPDGVRVGMVRALGWEDYQRQDDPRLYDLPETTVEAVAADIRTKLSAQTLRVVGDPAMKVARAALLPGAAPFTAHRHALQRDDVELLVIGEAREWETVEYVADAVSAGMSKALIVIGHVPSEQAGMEECVRWLRTFIDEVPVELVPAADPFWAPARP
jgi:putative NIF3 family GTP cyclohydrolase 1 type 2